MAKSNWKQKYEELRLQGKSEVESLRAQHQEEIISLKKRHEMALKDLEKNLLGHITRLKERNEAKHLQYLGLLSDNQSLSAGIEFWKKKAKGHLNEIVRRGSVRALYNFAYAIFRDFTHAGYPLNEETFLKICKDNPNVNVREVAYVFEEFGLKLPEEKIRDVQNARANRSTIEIKDKDGKVIQYTFDIETRVRREDMDAALEDLSKAVIEDIEKETDKEVLSEVERVLKTNMAIRSMHGM